MSQTITDTILEWITNNAELNRLKKQTHLRRDMIAEYMSKNKKNQIKFINDNEVYIITIENVSTVYIDPTKLSVDSYNNAATTRNHQRLTLIDLSSTNNDDSEDNEDDE